MKIESWKFITSSIWDRVVQRKTDPLLNVDADEG